MSGIMHKTAAINCYQMKTGQQVRKSGLIQIRNGLLVGRPDGFVDERTLLEVKCLAIPKDRVMPKAILFETENKTLKQFCLTETLAKIKSIITTTNQRVVYMLLISIDVTL